MELDLLEYRIADLLAHRFENEDLHGDGTDEQHGADQVEEDDQLMIHGRATDVK